MEELELVDSIIKTCYEVSNLSRLPDLKFRFFTTHPVYELREGEKFEFTHRVDEEWSHFFVLFSASGDGGRTASDFCCQSEIIIRK